MAFIENAQGKSYISVINPGSGTYYIKDSQAWEKINELNELMHDVGSSMHFKGKYASMSALAAAITAGSYTPADGDVVIISPKEYVYYNGEWIEFGDENEHVIRDELGNLAFKDDITVALTRQTDVVLGESTTFTNAASSVSFSGGSTDKVFGEATTATVPAYKGTTKYMAATATGAALSTDNSSAITALGTPSTVKFVKSYPGVTKKLETQSITPINGTVNIPNVTGNTSVTVPVVSSNADVTIPNITNTGSASTWNFSVSNETLSITGGNGSAPTLGTALKATNTVFGTATSASKVTLGTAISAAKAGTAVTVATGALVETDTSGGTVMTGLGTASTQDGVTGYPNVTNDTFLTSASVSSQPTIVLSEESATAAGRVAYTKSIGTNGTNSVTFGTNDVVEVVKTIGTATAAAQTITVGANDKVEALTKATEVYRTLVNKA